MGPNARWKRVAVESKPGDWGDSMKKLIGIALVALLGLFVVQPAFADTGNLAATKPVLSTQSTVKTQANVKWKTILGLEQQEEHGGALT